MFWLIEGFGGLVDLESLSDEDSCLNSMMNLGENCGVVIDNGTPLTTCRLSSIDVR